MKKKGLIIATIVMVLVLAVSLTTATYAWFQVANVTTLGGFTVGVEPGTDVMIGLKKNNTYDGAAIADDFVFGEGLTYAPAETAGGFGLGTWSGGTQGLGAKVEYADSVTWGTQNMAVGVTTGTIGAEGTAKPGTSGNTGLWDYDAEGTKTVIAANGANHATIDAAAAHAAVANDDYAYLFLGVQPTTKLTRNNIVILLDASDFTGQNAGILAAVHVAYRLNSDDEWEDIDLFGEVNYDETLKSPGLAGTILTAYNNSYKVGNVDPKAPTKGAYTVIQLGTDAQAIDQIEIVIYIAGEDEDCLNGALNGAEGNIKIFFDTEKYVAPEPTPEG